MDTLQLAAIGLRRLGLGSRPGDLDRVSHDPRAAFEAEIRRGAEQPVIPGVGDTPAILRDLREQQIAARTAREVAEKGGSGMTAGTGAGVTEKPDSASGPLRPMHIQQREAEARRALAAASQTGFAERMVWFWANHFAVSAARSGQVRAVAGSYEREAIRPHVFGRFRDMLQAVETHPAMLMYLDNTISVGPNSKGGSRRGRGLNENLAREILELHTLGVNGGYSQADVTALAKILTGWTVMPQDDKHGPAGTGVFNHNLHEPGAHAVLGTNYREEGPEQFRRVLAAIARHPATATHLATKLARHFVADDPPPALVERLRRTFLQTDGDLAAVSRALLDAPEAWDAEPKKIRSPQEFLLATGRLLGPSPEDARLLRNLFTLGQPHWTPPGPNGYPDTLAHWANPEGLKTRLDLAARMASHFADTPPIGLLDAAFGPLASAQTRQTVSRAGDKAQGIAILLMSPEFQRR